MYVQQSELKLTVFTVSVTSNLTVLFPNLGFTSCFKVGATRYLIFDGKNLKTIFHSFTTQCNTRLTDLTVSKTRNRDQEGWEYTHDPLHVNPFFQIDMKDVETNMYLHV